MNEPTVLASEPKGYCRNCGKSLTAETIREVRGAYFCEDCLAQCVARPPAPAGNGSPTLAAVLGFVPGLGAVYNGEYIKALIHVLIFGTIIWGIDKSHAEAFFVPLLIAFIFYMPVEAYRTAKAKALGQPTESLFSEKTKGLPLGPIVLIGVGFLLLMDRFIPDFTERIFEFWPVLLIVLGVVLLRRRMEPSPSSEGTQNEQRN